MTASHSEPSPRMERKKKKMKILRRNTMSMFLFCLYTVVMIKVANTAVVTENSNYTTEEFEGVPLSLTSRTARSNNDELVLVEPRGRPNDYDEQHYRPYFDDNIITNISYQLTKTAFLHCTIRQLGDKVVSWVRQRDLHIMTVGKYTYTTDLRFTSIHLENSDDWTLEIRDTRKSDAGVYECQVSTEPKMSIAIRLNIIVVEAYISEGPILYMKSGSPVNITCYVKDQVGTVFLFWYLEGKVLDEEEKKRRGIEVFTEFGQISTSRLYIAKAKESDSGNYSCHPSYSEPANISLQVLNGEKPAAMQHGRKNEGSVVQVSLGIILLLSFFFLM